MYIIINKQKTIAILSVIIESELKVSMRLRIKRQASLLGITIGCILVLLLKYIKSDLLKTQKLFKDSNDTKYILFWNGFFHQRNWHFKADTSDKKVLEEMGCEETRCVFTSNKSLKPIKEFDAVLFHLYAYLTFPTKRSPKQIYIMATMESPRHTLMHHSYNDIFNWTSKFLNSFFI